MASEQARKETLSVITTDAYIEEGMATESAATPVLHQGGSRRRASRKSGIAASANTIPFTALYAW